MKKYNFGPNKVSSEKHLKSFTGYKYKTNLSVVLTQKTVFRKTKKCTLLSTNTRKRITLVTSLGHQVKLKTIPYTTA